MYVVLIYAVLKVKKIWAQHQVVCPDLLCFKDKKEKL